MVQRHEFGGLQSKVSSSIISLHPSNVHVWLPSLYQLTQSHHKPFNPYKHRQQHVVMEVDESVQRLLAGGERLDDEAGDGDGEDGEEGGPTKRPRNEEFDEEDEDGGQPLVAADDVAANLKVWARTLQRPPKGNLKVRGCFWCSSRGGGRRAEGPAACKGYCWKGYGRFRSAMLSKRSLWLFLPCLPSQCHLLVDT